ncbi:hypothetical protein IscW_ISCW004663 [Ixodes scapularis]|uniref:Uncharacterized protein n=1 Tax=Ixodes scapularis TaxID=6945 RepID=B7PK23_IXOSC|nr:hypothetical protein IscW_ISCW004663 [Ixodes scapularis]|eukprot:XP_002409149.1 hypothetical protein IscW_ISCW004663 [Ixodes scapularis]
MPIRCNSEGNLLEAVAEERAINKMTHRSQDDTQVSAEHRHEAVNPRRLASAIVLGCLTTEVIGEQCVGLVYRALRCSMLTNNRSLRND